MIQDPHFVAQLASQELGAALDADMIVSELGTLKGWEARFRYIIQLGDRLLPLPGAYRQEDNRVPGCESQVWLVLHCDAEHGVLLTGDSEARIVRGLIALVVAAFNGQSAQAIKDFDVERYFQRLDLLTHLSPSRGNGLRAIVDTVKQQASTLLSKQA